MQSTMIQLLILVCLSGLISSDDFEEEKAKSRQKRSTDCSPIYNFNSAHSACVTRSSHVVSAGVTEAEKILIVNEHNTYRGNADPTAEDMTKLYWNDQIAFVAQTWAENCVFAHDDNWNRLVPGRYNLGQNLAKSTVKSPWANMIRAWHNEVNIFTYAGDNSGKTIGHYTQMMSAKATLIGCGYANCGTQGHIYACNYGPPGGTGNQPYTNGTSCAQCPSQCNNNLCDCNGKVCMNGGTLDLNTCTCTCRRNFHILEHDCTLNCSDAFTDPWTCGTGSWIVSKCTLFSNLPYDCPKMCSLCPYGEHGYLESLMTTPPGGSSNNSGNTTDPQYNTAPSGIQYQSVLMTILILCSYYLLIN